MLPDPSTTTTVFDITKMTNNLFTTEHVGPSLFVVMVYRLWSSNSSWPLKAKIKCNVRVFSRPDCTQKHKNKRIVFTYFFDTNGQQQLLTFRYPWPNPILPNSNADPSPSYDPTHDLQCYVGVIVAENGTCSAALSKAYTRKFCGLSAVPFVQGLYRQPFVSTNTV